MFNFGQLPNEKKCSCGRHMGVGEWSPEQRAAFYKRMSNRMRSLMSAPQIAYMQDWEAYHGPIIYTMGVVAQNTGTFNKADKGKDVWGPVFIEPAPKQAAMF